MILIKIPALTIVVIAALLLMAVALLVAPLILPESRPYLRKGFNMLWGAPQRSLASEGLGD